MFPDLSAPSTSLYCERTSPEFWAEPLNAVSSLVVVLVAIVGFVLLWRRGQLSVSVTILMILAASIGVGSFLLHTYATVWAEIADVVPIWSFVVVYGLLALRRFAPDSFSLPYAALFSLSVMGSGIALASGDLVRATPLAITSGFSGSAQYFPAALMSASVFWFIWKARHPSLLRLGLGVGLFGLALLFRSLDMRLCEAIPTGTHFMWHVTNCLVFWYLIEAYASHRSPPAQHSRDHGVAVRGA
ncbi:ceramidase domain-containing protein [Antarctobacter heliothermus]|uniref:Ceramidase n=1 Tax=Antarctobacter heliothermus TaxID=74033 RepID=A0A239AUL5_9RHOB|nr:ceramidase domain-containing protein [Antarctobacter heliothermus]SNR99260.1 Ceramidase [Antarctobacter heliothermus]